MLQNVQRQDEKENTFLFLYLWSVVICKTVFTWKLRFVCLLDQGASLCQLCCHNDSSETSYLWNHFENWNEGGEENNSSLSKIHSASLYIYLIYLQKFLREASHTSVFWTHLPKKGFLTFSLPMFHCVAILFHINNNNLWQITYLYISVASEFSPNSYSCLKQNSHE